jgi:hypothetical protein
VFGTPITPLQLLAAACILGAACAELRSERVRVRQAAWSDEYEGELALLAVAA